MVVDVTVHFPTGGQFKVKGPQNSLLDCGVGIKYVKHECGSSTVVGKVTVVL